jgi:hypothetical protein
MEIKEDQCKFVDFTKCPCPGLCGDMATNFSTNSHCRCLVDDIPVLGSSFMLVVTIMFPSWKCLFWKGYLLESLQQGNEFRLCTRVTRHFGHSAHMRRANFCEFGSLFCFSVTDREHWVQGIWVLFQKWTKCVSKQLRHFAVQTVIRDFVNFTNNVDTI